MTVEIQGSRRGIILSAIIAAMFIAAGFWASRRTSTVTSASFGIALPDAPPAAPLSWRPLGEPGSGGAMTAFAFDPRKPERLFVAGDMLGIGVSNDNGKTYGGGFGLPSFEIADFTFHPTNAETVWAGTMSGPALSTDGGQTWKVLRSGFPETNGGMYSAPVEKILFVEGATNPAHLLAFGGSSRRWNSPGEPAWGAVWESTSGGESWTRLVTLGASGAVANGKGRNIVSASQSSDGDILYAGLDGAGVWRSGDSGKTWAKATGFPHDNVERVVADPKNPRTVYAVFDNAPPARSGEPRLPGGIYKSVDGGTTWRGIVKGLNLHANPDPNFTARFKAFCVSPANTNVLFVSDSSWNKSAIYRSA
ncbi:MAG: exo-alpha-sialidase, partial [Armatimonadetes bacterium]|nr:exo-alpha-sialidase [Armatimonadota bacterium]